jgi:hypothetical protein
MSPQRAVSTKNGNRWTQKGKQFPWTTGQARLAVVKDAEPRSQNVPAFACFSYCSMPENAGFANRLPGNARTSPELSRQSGWNLFPYWFLS